MPPLCQLPLFSLSVNQNKNLKGPCYIKYLFKGNVLVMGCKDPFMYVILISKGKLIKLLNTMNLSHTFPLNEIKKKIEATFQMLELQIIN